jgi:protocatechuate 3,4-dioxygenase beta subunit
VQVVATPEDRGAVLALLDSRRGGYASDVSDGGGAFRLRGLKPGTYRVRASQAHSVQAPSFWLSPGVIARTGATDVRVVLPREGALRGRVELAGGRIPARFSVALTLLPPTEFQAPQGDFRLDDVPPGHHTVTITAPGARPKTIEGIELAPGEEKDLGRVVLDRGRTIAGQVVDASGQPVAGASVLAGPQVLGDGQRLGGAELHALSDGAGRFTLEGAGDGALQLMAEHPSRGRSRLYSVGDGDLATALQLSLEPFAALEGQVTSQNAPVAQAPVVVAPRGSPAARFFVSTQSDGRYRFDRLAPGEYLVTTVLRPDATTQILESVPARIGEAGAAGEGGPAHADIDVQVGPNRLGVQLLEADGRPVGNAQVYLSSGAIAAPPTTLGGLETALAERGPGRTQIGLLLQGRPLVFSQLQPGAYTLCAIAVRGNLDDPSVVQQVRDRAASLPSVCAPVTVAPGPPEQQAVLRLPAAPPS